MTPNVLSGMKIRTCAGIKSNFQSHENENVLGQDVTNPVLNTHFRKAKKCSGKMKTHKQERGHCVAIGNASQQWLPFSVLLCPLRHLCNCLFSCLAPSEPRTQTFFVRWLWVPLLITCFLHLTQHLHFSFKLQIKLRSNNGAAVEKLKRWMGA